MKARKLFRLDFASIEIVDRPTYETSCDCCGEVDSPTCIMCEGGRCADCLDSGCRCCSAPRGKGNDEDIECQHEWDEAVWFCLKCGETEPPEGAEIIEEGDGGEEGRFI